MSAGVEAALSVILVVTESFRSIRLTVRHLHEQTVRRLIELVIVAPDEESLSDRRPGELEGFSRVTVVEVGPISNVDRALAPGILRASAPVVALIEDHAYPEPEWAETLLEAHRGPWAAVGSEFVNANPKSSLSWVSMLVAYGRWLTPANRGEIDMVSRHNSSFKRRVLDGYGEGLADRLGRGGDLLQDLRARGNRFYLEPRSRIAHANPSRLSAMAELRFNAGRLFGARRAETNDWTLLIRLLRAGASPIVPFIKLGRIQRQLLRERSDLVPRVYPALLLGLTLDALGEAFGYLFGVGRSLAKLTTFEMDRMRHLNAGDRKALAK